MSDTIDSTRSRDVSAAKNRNFWIKSVVWGSLLPLGPNC